MKKKTNRAGGRKAFLLVFACFVFLLAAGGCSSKETVLLETEDLVEAPYEEEQEQVEQSTLFVHICGAVKSPGVYELLKEERIYDAVRAAGGFTLDADENYVNMAAPLEDGRKIVIPTLEETAAMPAEETALWEDSNSKKDGDVSGTVNINTADKQELCTLPGIGLSRAESIIAYREKNGGFSKPEDIMRIEGIKEGMFMKLKDKIRVE